MYNLTAEKLNQKKRITVELRGQILTAAMDLRAKHEKERETPVSLASVVREAILFMHRREVPAERVTE